MPAIVVPAACAGRFDARAHALSSRIRQAASIDRVNDGLVAGAAADVALEVLEDLVLGRVRVLASSSAVDIIRKPGVQKPHCRAKLSTNASCSGCSPPAVGVRPSTVVTVVPSASAARIGAGADRPAVDQHRAYAAYLHLAADLGAGAGRGPRGGSRPAGAGRDGAGDVEPLMRVVTATDWSPRSRRPVIARSCVPFQLAQGAPEAHRRHMPLVADGAGQVGGRVDGQADLVDVDLGGRSRVDDVRTSETAPTTTRTPPARRTAATATVGRSDGPEPQVDPVGGRQRHPDV